MLNISIIYEIEIFRIAQKFNYFRLEIIFAGILSDSYKLLYICALIKTENLLILS